MHHDFGDGSYRVTADYGFGWTINILELFVSFLEHETDDIERRVNPNNFKVFGNIAASLDRSSSSPDRMHESQKTHSLEDRQRPVIFSQVLLSNELKISLDLPGTVQSRLAFGFKESSLSS